MQLTVDIDDDKRSECDPWHGGQSSAHKINYIFNLFCTRFVIILQAVLLWHSLQKFEYKPIHREKGTDKANFIALWEREANAANVKYGLSKIYILTVKQFFFSAIFLKRIFLFPLPVHDFVILLLFFLFPCFLYPYPLRSTHFLTTRPQGAESGTNKTVTHHLQYSLSFNWN